MRELEFKKLNKEISDKSFDEIVSIENSSYEFPYPEDALRECVEELDTFACYKDGEVVGYITFKTNSNYFGSIYIVNLCVSSAHRGQGIAKRLMYEGYKYYKITYNEIDISLDVEKDNKACNLICYPYERQ